jgi:hypothetical protein
MNNDDDDNNNNSNPLFACQQRVVYNRRILKLYVTKSTIRLELELELEFNHRQ